MSKLENNEDKLEDIKIAVPLKYLSNFIKSLIIPLTNCEISLDLRWSKNCILTSKATRTGLPAGPANNLQTVDTINNPTNAEFLITDCKLYVPVVTLLAENENILLEHLKTRFPVTIEWNKHRCQISN